MNEKTIIIASEIILANAIIIALATILIAAWYDFRAATYKKQLRDISLKLTKSRQPFVTIIVYAHNNAQKITDCLDGIRNSDYINYRIVIANHRSTDNTIQLVKKYQKSHPKIDIILYTAQPSVRYSDVLERAVKKAPSSDFIMRLPASSFIMPNTLRDGISYFTAHERVTHLQLRQLVDRDVSIQTLTPHFLALSKNIFYKALSVTHLLPKSNHSVSMYRSSSHSEKHYFASTIAHVQSANTKRTPQLSKVIILIGLLILFGFISYWLWTAAILKSNLLLTLSWAAVCIWLLAAIWSDNLIRLTKKIELSVSVPFMYFVFYAQTIASFFIGLWQSLRAIPFNSFTAALQAELYSTRY